MPIPGIFPALRERLMLAGLPLCFAVMFFHSMVGGATGSRDAFILALVNLILMGRLLDFSK